jgi:hypothetical protein
VFHVSPDALHVRVHNQELARLSLHQLAIVMNGCARAQPANQTETAHVLNSYKREPNEGAADREACDFSEYVWRARAKATRPWRLFTARDLRLHSQPLQTSPRLQLHRRGQFVRLNMATPLDCCIYSKRGDSRDQFRLLYMNASALALWKDMGKVANVIGEAKRPPASAELVFGVPFSE